MIFCKHDWLNDIILYVFMFYSLIMACSIDIKENNKNLLNLYMLEAIPYNKEYFIYVCIVTDF